VWDKAQAILAQNGRKRAGMVRAQTPALLKGLVFGPTGRAMSPTHTRKGKKLYRYYLSQTVIKGDTNDCPINRVPAAEIERAVIDQLRVLLQSPEIIVATWRTARKAISGLTESEVREILIAFEPLWDELFPAEQARIVRLLVQRVQIDATGIDITLHPEGPSKLVTDLRGAQREAA
jgi:hypothetical protein